MNRVPSETTYSQLNQSSSAADVSAPSKKIAACNACRDRKTRCVGSPVCQYCARNNLPCSRADEQPKSPLDLWGEQILVAIRDAKQDLISASLTYAHSPLQSAPDQRQRPVCDPSGLGLDPWPRLGGLVEYAAPGGFSVNKVISSASPALCSPHAILTWPVWRLTPAEVSSLLSEHNQSATLQVENAASVSASTSLTELRRWQSNFVHRYIKCYPVVDAAQLRRLTTVTAENGPGWNSESCLLLLVCALGAQCHADSFALQEPKDIAQRYWGMAKRRLGWALDGDSVVSTQCFALAALWHIHALEPYKAQKMLSLAICEPARRFVSSNVLSICLSLHLMIAIGLGVPTQPSSNLEYQKDYGTSDSSSSSGMAYPGETVDKEAIRGLSVQEALRGLQLLHSRILQFNQHITLYPPWRTLFLIFKQLSGLSLELDTWSQNLPDSIQSRLAEVVTSATGQSYQPLSLNEWGEGRDGIHLMVLYREVRLLLLSPSLMFILTPVLTQQLSEATCPPLVAQQLLDRITADANACLCIALGAIHDASRFVLHPKLPEVPVAASTSPPAQYHNNRTNTGNEVEPCNHVQVWLLLRCAFRYSLLLSAGLRASTEYMRAESSDIAFLNALRMPENSKVILDKLAKILLDYPKGTDLWSSGRILASVCQDTAAPPISFTSGQYQYH